MTKGGLSVLTARSNATSKDARFNSQPKSNVSIMYRHREPKRLVGKFHEAVPKVGKLIIVHLGPI